MMIAAYESRRDIDFFVPNIKGLTIREESEMLSRKKCNFIDESVKSHGYDALLIPGGLGAYKHLHEDETCFKLMQGIIEYYIKEKKPIIGICIAPKMIAKCIEANSNLAGEFRLTVGNDISHFSGLKKIVPVQTEVYVIFTLSFQNLSFFRTFA